MRKKLLSKLMLLLAFVLVGAGTATAQKVTAVDDIEDGGHYYIGCTVGETDYYLYVNPTESAKGVKKESTTDATEFIFNKGDNGWVIKIASSGKFITLPSSKDNAKVNVQDEAAEWEVTNESDLIQLKINGFLLQGNSGSSLNFGSYASGQKNVWLLPVGTNIVEKVKTPTFEPAAGEVEAGTVVTIKTETEGATIYYTTDGTEPTTESTKGTTVTINEATTIKAIAVADGKTNSAIATAAYTIKAEVQPVEDNADLTLDLTTAWNAENDNEAGEKVFSNDNYTITGVGAANFKFNDGYFIFGKSGAYLNLPKVDFAVEKIEVVGRAGASGKTVHNIYVGEDAVSEACTGMTGTSVFAIADDYQVANTQFTLKITSDHNGQVTYVKYYKKTESGTDPTPETAKATTVTIDATGITNTNLFAGTAAGKLTAVVKAGDEVLENAVVAWESSDENVAEVANDGTVTLVEAGTAIITASYAGVENQYKPSSKTYTLTVTNEDPNGPGTENNPYTVAQARAAIDAGAGVTGVYAKGIVSEIVTPFNSQFGNISYNISEDGTTTADQLQAYRGKSFKGDNFTSEDDIKVGDVVVIYGNLKKYTKDNVDTYEFDTNNQLVSLERDGTKQQAGLAYETTSFKVNKGESFTAPELTNPNRLTVTYTSSDESVATVDANTGAVTLAGGIGVTTIKAVFEGNDNYFAGEASYTLEVIDPNVPGKTVENAYTVAQAVAAIDAGEGVTGVYVKGIISQLDSYNSTYKSITYWISADGTTTDQFEVYSGRGLDNTDFAALTDLKLGDEVVIYGNIKKYGDVYEFDKQNYIVSLVRAEKQEAGLAYETTSFTINEGESFTAPVLTNPNNLDVTYTSSNESVATVDATGAVTLAGGFGVTTITAAFEGNDSFFEGEASYTLNVVNPNANDGSKEKPYTVAEARAAIDAGAGITGVYAKGIVSKIVTAYNAQYGNISYNISEDGTTTADQLQAYRGFSYDGAQFTSKDDIQVGDEVVIYGNLKKYNTTYEFDAGNQLVSLVRTQIDVAAPTFSVAAGEVAAGTKVELVQADAEEIWYTTDGTDPSWATGVGDLYTDPIVIDKTMTIKAIAVIEKYESPIAVATYTVKGDEPIVEPTDENGWVKTTWAELTPNDVFVIVGTNADGAFAMSNDNGTAKAPVPVAVTVDGAKLVSGVTENIQWTVGSSDNGYIFYPAGTTDAWLYCTNTNNGVRVGTGDASVFTVSEEGYLYNVGNNRYIGIYNSQDWRCYTSINNNIKDQTFAVYKKVGSLVTITDAGWASWVAPYDAKISDGVSAYIVTEVAADKVMLAEVENVPEGTPVLLKGAEGVYGFGAAETLDNVADNLLQAADGNVKGNGSIYALGKNSAGQVGFNKVAEGVVVPEGKAYLVVSAAVRDFLAFTNGEADGINTIENGQLTIGNVVYDLSGRRVSKTVKGLYIVNGKKVVK